jgi:hypothetical protein
VKNVWGLVSTPPYVLLHSAMLNSAKYGLGTAVDFGNRLMSMEVTEVFTE